LRTLDAVNLAIAQGIRCPQLATADESMADAGKAAGLGIARFFSPEGKSDLEGLGLRCRSRRSHAG
jgi:hypothetical protein